MTDEREEQRDLEEIERWIFNEGFDLVESLERIDETPVDLMHDFDSKTTEIGDKLERIRGIRDGGYWVEFLKRTTHLTDEPEEMKDRLGVLGRCILSLKSEWLTEKLKRESTSQD